MLPIFLKEELTFPYRYGLDFTLALLQAGGKDLAYAGAFKDPPKTTREIMEPKTYLAHEKLEPMKMIDMEKDFKGYDAFDIGAMGEFDVDVLVEQYAGRDEATAMYPEWRGGYYFAGKPKGDKSAPIASAVCFALVESRRRPRSSPPCMRSRWRSAIRNGKRWERTAKSRKTRPRPDSWRTLRGRHAWLTEEGVV